MTSHSDRRPFLRTHRPLPPRHPHTAAGIRAMSPELDRRPIAEDVGRVLPSMFATEAVGG